MTGSVTPACYRWCHDQIINPTAGDLKMTKDIAYTDYCDSYEYHGSTTIEQTRSQDGVIIWRDWIIFDTVEEATEYFNDTCVMN